jgi:hypothetical protein
VQRKLAFSVLALALAGGAGPVSAAGEEALIAAVKRQDGVAVGALLDRGATFRGRRRLEGVALAAQGGDLAPSSYCSPRAPRSTRPPVQRPTIEPSSNNGNRAIVERLLQAGADPNATSREGQTAPGSGVERRRCGSALLANGALVDATALTAGNGADVGGGRRAIPTVRT